MAAAWRAASHHWLRVSTLSADAALLFLVRAALLRSRRLSCLPVCSCGEMGGRNPTVPSRASTMSSHFVFVSTNLNKLRDIHDSRARAGMGRTDDGRRRRMVGERMMDDEMVEDEMMLP